MKALSIPENRLSMTSREIAELTGKRHKHVCRDIRDMLAQIYGGEPDAYSPENIITNQEGPVLDPAVYVAQYDVNNADQPVYEYLRMTCPCDACRPNDPAPTYTRAYLLDCLARDIAQTDGGNPDAIKTRLARFGKSHDPETTQHLTAAVRRAWSAQRVNP